MSVENTEKPKKIYLDANASTIMPAEIIETMIRAMNKGNPSSAHESAQSVMREIQSTRKTIAKICEFTLADNSQITEYRDNDLSKEPRETDYTVIFTSGASESNATIIRMVVEASQKINRTKPHIIITAIEHKSVIDTAQQLADSGYLDLSIVKPDKFGFISAESIKSHIKYENDESGNVKTITALICVIHGNNETGAINNIKEIGEMCNRENIPLHVDTVQTFGKDVLRPVKMNVDSFSLSFHKLHGPVGCGVLVIRDLLIRGYELKAMIGGTQNFGLRGGTENYPAIIASKDALIYTLTDRTKKNNNLLKCKELIIKLLKKTGIPIRTLAEYYSEKSANEIEIIIISLPTKNYLPNTLMLSIVKRSAPEFCNVEFRKLLEKNRVIVSIGSACNTQSTKASHVIYAMDFDDYLRKGVLRISLPDDITEDTITQFVRIFANSLKEILGK